MRNLQQSIARSVMVLMTDITDPTEGLAGLTLTITASKNGAAFAAIAGDYTDRGNGWYSVNLDAADVDTLGDLALHITAPGANDTDVVAGEVTTRDADLAIALGLMHRNVLIDNTTNTVDGLESARIRIFEDAATCAAATPDAGGLEGAIASFTVETVYEAAGKIAHYRVTED